MKLSKPLDSELDQIIRRLGYAATEIMLLSISAPALPTATLLTSLRSVSNSYHLIGLLPDGSVGLIGLTASDHAAADGLLEQQFIPRLQVILDLVCAESGFGCTEISYRSICRRSDALQQGSDLIQSLCAQPEQTLLVGSTASHEEIWGAQGWAHRSRTPSPV